MSTFRPRRPSAATLIAIGALFVALGGTGYAAFSLPKNSVGTKQLRNGAVTRKKLANNAVSGAKVAAGSLTGKQINASTLGTVPNATHASSADNATHASSADNASALSGLTANQFVQGGGVAAAGRAALVEGDGGLQPIVAVPGFGEVTGGCGSGGGEIGFVNHFGHDLRVYPFAGADIAPVTFSDGAFSGLLPSGAGSAGMTILQIGSTDFTDQRVLTVIATRDAEVSGQCNVQAWAVTR